MIFAAAIQLVFVDDVIIITDDVGSVEVCVAVADELVNDDVFFRIPIVVETVENGTARESMRICTSSSRTPF